MGKQTVDKQTFQNVFTQYLESNMDPCHDETAVFSDDVESQRHVYEVSNLVLHISIEFLTRVYFQALDILYPKHAGNWKHWKGKCTMPQPGRAVFGGGTYMRLYFCAIPDVTLACMLLILYVRLSVTFKYRRS